MNSNSRHPTMHHSFHFLIIIVLISLLLSPQVAASAAAQSNPPQSIAALMASGNAHLDADQYDDAIARFDQVIEAAPTHARAYRQRGDAYRLKREYQQALADLDQAILLVPDDHLSHAIRGVTLIGLTHYEDAIQSFNRALQLHSDHIWSLANRGRAYYELGEFESALTDLDQAIALNSQYEWAIIIRGKIYMGLEDDESAILDFSRAIALNAQSEWAFALRGQTYRQLERYEEALIDLNRAVALNPEYAWALAQRGYTYQLAADYPAALTDFTEALTVNPMYDWAYAQRGKTYALLTEYEEAIADFTKAIAIDTTYSWAYIQRGLSHQELEAHEEAIVDFTKAIELQANNEWYWAVRADAHRLAGQYEAALQDVDQAIALTPEYDFAWGVRGHIHRQMEELKIALTDFDRAIALAPEYSWAYTMRGEIHQLLGNSEAALADFQRAAALNEADAVTIETGAETETTAEITGEAQEETLPTSATAPVSDTSSTPTEAAHAVIRIETIRGDYVDFWETEVTGRAGHGSGFIIDPKGIAVTNNHVVTGATILKVYIGDNDTPFSARVLGVNECADLAVIQIQGEEFPAVKWRTDAIERRLPVEAIGFPLDAAQATFTQGIISATEADGQTPWSALEHVLLHSAVINPGSSGGPLVDAQGDVVGINYRGSSTRNQYFAISRDDALPIVEALRQGLDEDAIGINGEAFVQENGATGIWVYSVQPGSPADQAGIQAGDILASLGGIPLGHNGTMQSYCEIVRSHNATDTINIEVYRMSERATCIGQLNGRSLQCTSETAASPTTESPTISYHRLTVEEGAMVMEKPRDWQDTKVTFWEWNEEPIGLRVGIAPELEKFYTTWDHSGLSLSVSTHLAGQMSPDELLDQTSFRNTCTFVERQEFEQNRYQGQLDLWKSCDGAAQNRLVVAAFMPANDAFIALLIFQSTKPAELDIVDRLINSLAVNPEIINAAPRTARTGAPTPASPPTATPTRQPPATATVLVETLNVRTGPSTDYAILGVAKRDQTFAVIAQANNCAWVMIEDSSGKQGWLAAAGGYARVTGNCRELDSGEILPTPTRSPNAFPPIQPTAPSGDGCITFKNELNVELNITFTGQSGQGSRNFRVGGHSSLRQCFAPGPYTYTMDAPPPWDDINGDLDVQRGMNITFPVRGSN